MTKQLNKKGTSLVELIAVIVIMGIIAGIAIPTTIAVIARQRKSAAMKSGDNIVATAKQYLLSIAATGEFDEGTATAVTTSGSITGYSVTAAQLVTAGELEKNPITSGTLTITITLSNNKFQLSHEANFKIDNQGLEWDSAKGQFKSGTAAKSNVDLITTAAA